MGFWIVDFDFMYYSEKVLLSNVPLDGWLIVVEEVKEKCFKNFFPQHFAIEKWFFCIRMIH